MATLRVVSTLARELEGRSFALGAEGTSVGRDGANRIVVPEASVSRRHARIEVVAGDYQIVDQRSSNGTFVNGEQVSLHRLGDGDTVRIGRTTFVFELGGGAVANAGLPGPLCEDCAAVAPPGSRFCATCGKPFPQPPGSTTPTPRPASRAPTAPEIPIRRDSELAPAEPLGVGEVERAAAMGSAAQRAATAAALTSPGTAPPRRSRSGWVIGCALLALLLLATGAAGVFLLRREGRIDLPGLPFVPEVASAPSPR